MLPSRKLIEDKECRQALEEVVNTDKGVDGEKSKSQITKQRTLKEDTSRLNNGISVSDESKGMKGLQRTLTLTTLN